MDASMPLNSGVGKLDDATVFSMNRIYVWCWWDLRMVFVQFAFNDFCLSLSRISLSLSHTECIRFLYVRVVLSRSNEIHRVQFRLFGYVLVLVRMWTIEFLFIFEKMKRGNFCIRNKVAIVFVKTLIFHIFSFWT